MKGNCLIPKECQTTIKKSRLIEFLLFRILNFLHLTLSTIESITLKKKDYSNNIKLR